MASITTQDMQEQFLSTIRKGQEMTIDALKTWVETVQSLTQSLPSIPSVSLPLADRLPNPHEVVASGYDFAEQILTNQRKFTDEVLEVASPLLPGEESKSASKSAAAK
ncbi:MAG TPA: hypothetical protein VHN16_01765 [Streptosporangiaceae bacterium]|jgi:hypothetical protein|nr:hypothetical protein [Streptosporangiaceae bacterium]